MPMTWDGGDRHQPVFARQTTHEAESDADALNWEISLILRS